MNLIERVKLLPKGTRRLLSVGIILALVVALPLFIWAIVTGNFNLNNKAASGEPGVCVPQNKTITVTPNSDVNGNCHDIQAAVDAVTGSGFTVQIQPGTYNVATTINVANKDTIDITGDPNAGSGAANIIFNNGTGWGFRVTNSTGTIEWLTASGFTPNGLLEVENSAGFTVAYANLNATSSHTLGVSNSNYFNIYNTEIQSSAGSLTIGNTNNIIIGNNRIHDSADAISIYNAQNISIFGNLVYSNRERALRLSNINGLVASHNTFVNNGLYGVGNPAVDATGSMSGAFTVTDNIVAMNAGGGLHFSGTTSSLSGSFQRNDIYGNSTNYVGIPDQTGINGNISSNPQLNSANSIYCPINGSSVIYGNVGTMEYMGYIGPCGGVVPTPTPSASAYPSPTPSASPNASQSIIVRVKFAGVTDGSANGAKITLRFQKPATDFDYITSPIEVSHVGNGIYQATLTFGTAIPWLPTGTPYTISAKGEKHLATKFCFATGQTTRCTGNGNISIPFQVVNPAPYILEFTGLPLEPGDLYIQDGIANSADFVKIKTLLDKPCSALTSQDKLTADLDYNGCINTRDAFLMRQTLQTRYDDN